MQTLSADLHKCLCCGQPMTRRGNPVTPERAERALGILLDLGFRARSGLAESKGFPRGRESDSTC
jgi:hypothetical protein